MGMSAEINRHMKKMIGEKNREEKMEENEEKNEEELRPVP